MKGCRGASKELRMHQKSQISSAALSLGDSSPLLWCSDDHYWGVIIIIKNPHGQPKKKRRRHWVSVCRIAGHSQAKSSVPGPLSLSGCGDIVGANAMIASRPFLLRRLGIYKGKRTETRCVSDTAEQYWSNVHLTKALTQARLRESYFITCLSCVLKRPSFVIVFFTY